MNRTLMNRHPGARGPQGARRTRALWLGAAGVLCAMSVLWASVGHAQYGMPIADFEPDQRFKLFSNVFESGDKIPTRHTCDSRDSSPPLYWEGAPVRTESFALIMDDPDAPVGTFVHWVIFNIPPVLTELPEGIPTKEELPNGSRQGRNDFGSIGYVGPCPPRGSEHRYVFRFYALDAMLDAPPGITKQDLMSQIEQHQLSRTKLVGRYSR